MYSKELEMQEKNKNLATRIALNVVLVLSVRKKMCGINLCFYIFVIINKKQVYDLDKVLKDALSSIQLCFNPYQYRFRYAKIEKVAKIDKGYRIYKN